MSFNLQDLGKLIAQSAPLLGGALAGPAGATIGTLIAGKLGGNSTQPEALHALITADPQSALKLKEMELEHQFALEQLHVQSDKENQDRVASDRASARLREAEVDKTPTEQRDKTPAVLAYCLTACVAVALLWLLYFPVPLSNRELISTFVSTLATVWVGAMGYYHGSSAGSRLKDHRLVGELRGAVRGRDET